MASMDTGDQRDELEAVLSDAARAEADDWRKRVHAISGGGGGGLTTTHTYAGIGRTARPGAVHVPTQSRRARPMSDQPVKPRETVVFDQPGAHTFRPSDYPWLVAYRVHVQTPGAGTADGPGEAGYVMLELYDCELTD